MAEKELRSPVGGAEAGYLLEFRESGVYITIFPDSNGVLFELSDIRQILQECGVVDYDVVSLARIVRESSGEAQKLSDSFLSPEEMKALLNGEKRPAEGEFAEDDITLSEEEKALQAIPAEIIVEISRDRMQANVRFDTRKGKGLRSVSDIQEALAAKKVVFGINMESIKKGWLHTGDMARQDEEGFYYLVDRKKDVIISGGENLYPVQIESFLMGNSKIHDAAVIGLPDPRLGEIAAAIIQVKEGQTLTEDEVNQFCIDLPRYKRPRKIIFDKVLRNPTGKIDKPKLRQIYCGERLVEKQSTS